MGYGFYDITLYARSENSINKGLAIKNNLISDLYIDSLNGYKPRNTTRISADIGTGDDIRGYFGSILQVDVLFDENEYGRSSPEKQDQIILDTIHRIAIFCAEKYGWDKAVFDQAYREVIESDFTYKKESKKKLSNNKKHQASLLLEKDGNSATISVNFYNSEGEFLKSSELFKSFHHKIFYGKIIANYKWFNDVEFGIYLKDYEIVIKASLEKTKSEITINPITNTIEELEGYLRRITYREFADRSDLVNWANQ